MRIKKDETGYMMIEAAIIYPIIMIIFALFLYVILLCAQRAQMVSAAEQTIVYIKYICSGNYDIKYYDVSQGMNPDLSEMEQKTGMEVNDNQKLYNVYANLFDTPSKKVSKLKEKDSDGNDGIKKIFDYYMGTPLMGNIESYTIDSEAANYVLFTQLELKVEYKMKFFLNFAFIGGEALNEPTFTINVKGVISDNAETVRTLQYVDYLLYRTGLKKKIQDTTDKISSSVTKSIDKVKEWLGFDS